MTTLAIAMLTTTMQVLISRTIANVDESNSKECVTKTLCAAVCWLVLEMDKRSMGTQKVQAVLRQSGALDPRRT